MLAEREDERQFHQLLGLLLRSLGHIVDDDIPVFELRDFLQKVLNGSAALWRGHHVPGNRRTKHENNEIVRFRFEGDDAILALTESKTIGSHGGAI